jgi:hypothetical protein
MDGGKRGAPESEFDIGKISETIPAKRRDEYRPVVAIEKAETLRDNSAVQCTEMRVVYCALMPQRLLESRPRNLGHNRLAGHSTGESSPNESTRQRRR